MNSRALGFSARRIVASWGLAATALTVLAAWPSSAATSTKKWPLTTGQNVPYRVFSHTTVNGMPANSFGASVLPRVQAAFLAWTRTRVACTNWGSSYQGAFTTPSGLAAIDQNDNTNNVIWLGGSSWQHGNSVLGLTTISYTQTGTILDADMQLNNNVAWSNNGAANTYDYESVVLHEAGHFLGLDHTPSVAAAVMYPSVAPGEVKRTLAQVDVSDVCSMYPGSGMTGGQGAPCTGAGQCATGLLCRGKAGSSGGQVCTTDCSSGQACAAMFVCQDANVGKACLPPPPSADYCKFCTADAQCSSGHCLTDGSGHQWCSSTCSVSTPCPSGSVCIDPNTKNGCVGGACICVPQTADAVKCTGQCTGASCSSAGYACVSGTCEATGNEGDRCEVSGFCKDCMVCIGSSAAAYCRKCCGGQGQGGSCTSCTSSTCSSADACTAFSNTTDKLCYPKGVAAVCQACGPTSQCDGNSVCVGGKCHAQCDPNNPGTCQACQPTGPSTGVCACAGEERSEGQSCGGSTVAACRTGLTCINSVCRKPCTLTDSSSCPSGSVCKDRGGVAVCEAAGSRCGDCGANGCAAGLTCYQGRCYGTCPGDPAALCTNPCVDVSLGAPLCACDDQLGGVGVSCGKSPLAACRQGLSCVSGMCVSDCTPANASACTAPFTCQPIEGEAGRYACQNAEAMQKPGGAKTVSPVGQVLGPANTACGCSSSSANVAFGVLMLGLVALKRRRARATT